MAKKNKRKKGRSLDDLSEAEKTEIYSRAAKLRKASKSKGSKNEWKQSLRQDNMDGEFSQEKRTGKSSNSLNDWAEKALSKAGDMKIFDKELRVDLKEAIVVSLSRQGGILLYKNKQYDFMIKPEMFLQQKTELSVGEKVLFSFDKEDHCLLERALPRTQILSRPDPCKPGVERTIAVNMDVIIIVASLDSPRLNFNLIDRFLIGIKQTSAKPVLCINKFDLLSDASKDDLPLLDIYRNIGVDVYHCSAETGEGVEDLVRTLKGKSCVFLGTSGVGKSSLLNCIDPVLNLKTQETRERAAGRGRHTTVMAHMYQVREDIRFIDTPGVREFNFLDLDPTEVQYGFQEFEEFLPCKFNNCSHDHEKGCNIKDAVESGEVSEMRYESYRKIIQTIDVKRLPPKQRDNLLF
jgi:ribosome biogenesis GTPase